MKMYLGNTPIKSLNIKHYEMDTNSATMVPSDLQAGVTAFAKGKKVTGTGKSFEFANYGLMPTNLARYVPSDINIIEISSLTNPIKLSLALTQMKDIDFTTEQKIATVVIDSVEHEIKVVCSSNFLEIICDQTFDLEVFYGKDNYT